VPAADCTAALPADEAAAAAESFAVEDRRVLAVEVKAVAIEALAVEV
jgi:hypothetical protein